MRKRSASRMRVHRLGNGRGHRIVANLTKIQDALEGLTDIELGALKVASNEVPQVAPGLLRVYQGACDWELNRRRGYNYTLQPPEAAIDPGEDDVSIKAVSAMRESFTSGASRRTRSSSSTP